MKQYHKDDFVPLWIDPLKNQSRKLLRATKEIRRIAKEMERQLNLCYILIGLHPMVETFSSDEWKPDVHINTICAVCGVRFCPILWVRKFDPREKIFSYSDLHELGRHQTLPTYEVRRYRRSDAEEDIIFPACSGECEVWLKRLLISIELRRKQEWEKIKMGKQLLKEAKHYLKGNRRELSSSLKKESKQGLTLPTL